MKEFRVTLTGEDIALFCKAYRPHADRFGMLFESIQRHNRSSGTLFVVVPEEDLTFFKGRFGTTDITYLTDEMVVGGHRGSPYPWVQQQLVKLLFAGVSDCEAWLLLDSDFYFFRDFTTADFLDEEGRVSLVASPVVHKWGLPESPLPQYVRGGLALPTVDPAEAMLSIPSGHRVPSLGVMSRWSRGFMTRLKDRRLKLGPNERIPRIQAYFGRQGPGLSAMPGPVWTRESVLSFRDQHLAPRRLDYLDILNFAPWENIWVLEWELSRGCPGRYLMHPKFLHFAADDDIEAARASGWTTDDFAYRYLGLALAAGHQHILQY